jgi:hemin uptake protein HemP
MERKSMTTIADNRTFTTATAVDASHPQHEQVRVLVSELLRGGREAILEHHRQKYRLRITQNGKLILTK